MLSLSLRHTFTTAGTDCHRLASPEYPFPLDNRVVHLGLEDLEEAVFTDLLACLWSLDEGAGGVAERAGRRCHFWCRNKMIEKCQNKVTRSGKLCLSLHHDRSCACIGVAWQQRPPSVPNAVIRRPQQLVCTAISTCWPHSNLMDP